MLDNIKLILGLDNDDHDAFINFYIKRFTSIVLEYCNLETLTSSLESFIEDKIVSIVKPKISGGVQNTGDIKAITRGKTRIEYNVGPASSDNLNSLNILSESDKLFLNPHRRLRLL